VTADGWPYVQHRGGPPGFVKVLDPTTIAFADFRGNKQYVTTGNIRGNPGDDDAKGDDRVAMILMDYPSQSRLKILGRAELVEPDAQPERFQELIGRVRDPDYKAQVESIMVVHVEAYDWNCQQHIVPRYTAEQVQQVIAPLEARIEELEQALRAARK
jgi:hypothetical protein